MANPTTHAIHDEVCSISAVKPNRCGWKYCKRDCNIFQVFWFDILDENGLPFLEKTANRLSPESIFAVLD